MASKTGQGGTEPAVALDRDSTGHRAARWGPLGQEPRGPHFVPSSFHCVSQPRGKKWGKGLTATLPGIKANTV